MKRREFIKQAVVGAMAMHGLDQKAALADTVPVPLNPKGEWPIPGKNSRYLAQAELPCDMARAPKETWSLDLGRAQLAMRHPGIGDVDGDGKLEIGVIHDGGFFRCYDATNGNMKWEMPGVKQTTDVVTADIDGDGRPEFLEGLAAFKPIDQTYGRIVWEVDVPAAHSPVVAGVDGDGKCEIVICGTDGVVRVYK